MLFYQMLIHYVKYILTVKYCCINIFVFYIKKRNEGFLFILIKAKMLHLLKVFPESYETGAGVAGL